MSRLALKISALAMASCAFIAGPASAGYACVLVDDQGNTQEFANEGDGNLECGSGNNSDLDDNEDLIPPGTFSTAVGTRNRSAGDRSSAVGYENAVDGDFASAFGDSNIASGDGSNAFGGGYFLDSPSVARRNRAIGNYSNAFGVGNLAGGDMSSAVGVNNETQGPDSNAFGRNNLAVSGSNAYGTDNQAYGAASSAFGNSNRVYGIGSSAFGLNNRAYGYAVGREIIVGGLHSSAVGYRHQVGGDFSIALGSRALIGSLDLDDSGNPVLDANGLPIVLAAANNAIAIGANNFEDAPTTIGAGADNAIAIGRRVSVAEGAEGAVAIGRDSSATVSGSVAIGAGSVADRADSVSFGNVDLQRQLVNVAAASQDTDAVNLAQLSTVTTAFGGGASYAGGTFAAPTYVIQGLDYHDVGTAFGAVDGRITDLYSRITDAGGVQGPSGPQGPTGPQGPEGPAGGGPRSVVYDQDAGDTMTLKGANGTTISNVADGVAATDAVNKGQMDAGDASTLQSSKTYTDTTATQTLTSANAYTDAKFAAWNDQFEAVDDRFRQQDERIDRMSAMSGAYAGMAMNTSGLGGRNRIGVGVGGQGSEAALAVGYQRAVGNRASVSIGGAISGGEKSVMGGAGFSW